MGSTNPVSVKASMLVFAAINLFKLPAYSAVDHFAMVHVPTLRAMGVVALIGAVLGRRLVQWLRQDVFALVIQILLLVVLSYLITKSLRQMIGQ